MYLDASTFVEETSIEKEIQRLQRAEDERTRSTIVASLIGAILGWAIGVGQLVVIGSWDLVGWTYMPLIPFYSGLGWALFGMILGGSGLFSKPKESANASPQKSYSHTTAA
jgi:hypothetical protein